MPTNTNTGNKLTLFFTKVAENYILLTAILAPLVSILYIYYFTAQTRETEFSVPHEISMILAAVASAFIAYVATNNYKQHGNPVLRYIALGFYGFGLIYVWHGIATENYDDHQTMFLMFSSAARAIVAIYVTRGLFLLNRQPDPVEERGKLSKWLPHFLLFIAVDLAIFLLSKYVPSEEDKTPLAVNIVEGFALGLSLVSSIYVLTLKAKSPILKYYGWTFLFLAQGSLAAVMSQPWDSLWWFSHMLWAAGFSILCYAILIAYQHGGSLESIYGIDALLEQLSAAKEEIQIKDIELREYVDNMSTYNAKIDPKGLLLFANKTMLDAAGLTEADLTRVNFLELQPFNYDPEVGKRLRDAFDKALAQGLNVNYEERIRPASGDAVYLTFSLIPVKDREGKVSYVLAEGKDITEQVQAEEKIQAANKELENMNKMMIGREVKMAEMKKELESLKSKSGAAV